MIKQVIGVIPQSCGDYNPERPGGYDKAERVFLFGCEWESKVDGNTYAPAVKDSEGKVIPDEEHWYHCSGMIDSEKADKATTLAGYGITDAYTKSETYTKEEVNGLVDTLHQEYVTVNTYSALPATGSKDTIYRVSNYNGSTSQVDASVYSEYAWNGSQYIFLCVKSQIGEVFDISVYNNNAKYADLAAALNGGANIPQSLQKGGMSVKFVQSSDNKYVQYRCIANEFTTDTTQWAIGDEGVYVENPEFVRVILDNDGKIIEATRVDGTKLLPAGVEINEKIDFAGNKTIIIENPEFTEVKLDNAGHILWGIQKDGNIYYGTGVPKQVIDYITEKIAELSPDEYEDIVAFLNDLEKGDKTLQALLNEKVDKEEGKSLIDVKYASSQSAIDNPEYLQVTTDNNDKILEGIKPDGTKVIGGDIKVIGNMEVSGVSYKVIENPEYLAAWVDAEDKIIFGLKADGKTYVGDADFLNDIKNNQEAINEINATIASISSTIEPLDIDALTSITAVENPKFIEAKTDSEGKLLAGRTTDGAAFENIGFSTPKLSIDGHTIENIEDPEGRTEILTDTEGKIISYRDANGVKHEEVGIEAGSITFSGNGSTDFYQMLKEQGYAGTHDWSDKEFVEIPVPTYCAVVNIGLKEQVAAKGLDVKTYLQYWDKNGNYFKKPIVINAQGDSSMSYNIKNQGFDLDDGSEIKFGNWVPFDSFHIKKYFIDVFRGQCVVCYRLGEQVYNTRPISGRRPWSYMQNNASYDGSGSFGDFSKDFDNGAMAHPDGFPVHLFFNGKDAGIYAFNIKKARGNYNCKKSKQTQIILDGYLGSWFFTRNGDFSEREAAAAEVEQRPGPLWYDFEIRNPKIDKDIDGNKYNGDVPTEPSNDWQTCKNKIIRFTQALTAVNAEATIESKRAKFEEYFNVPFLIDYDLIGQIVYHSDGYRKNWIWLTNDGNIWSPTLYDLDSVFGQHWNGASYIQNSTTNILGRAEGLPTTTMISLYKSECDARYKELRDKGIFTADNIYKLFKEWIYSCGYENLKNDIENIAVSPYLENGEVVVDSSGNPVMIPNTPSYRDGTKTYLYNPQNGGWYNSLQRIYNWLNERIATLDSYYNYSSN